MRLTVFKRQNLNEMKIFKRLFIKYKIRNLEKYHTKRRMAFINDDNSTEQDGVGLIKMDYIVRYKIQELKKKLNELL